MLCVDIPSEASYDVILRSIQAGMDTTDRPIPIVLVTNPISGLSRCAPFVIITLGIASHIVCGGEKNHAEHAAALRLARICIERQVDALVLAWPSSCAFAASLSLYAVKLTVFSFAECSADSVVDFVRMTLII